MTDDLKTPQNDITERLQDLRDRIEVFPIIVNSQGVFKERAIHLVERQLVSGADFNTMIEVVYLLEKAMPPGPITNPAPWSYWVKGDLHIWVIRRAYEIFEFARDIFADFRIPSRVVPGSGCNPVPDNNPCENHKKPGWQTDGTFLVPPHRTVDAGKFCPTCGGWYPPDDSDDSGAASAALVML